MTIQLILYTTSHCHLCEQAEYLLKVLASDLDLKWTSIEIADDAKLLALYELKIPVLKRVDNHQEIYWPFTLNDIMALIE